MKLINPKYDESTLANIKSCIGQDEIKAYLTDGAELILNGVEFFNAVQILTCDEFSQYVEAKNSADRDEEQLSKAFKKAYDDPTTSNIYDVVYYAKYQGYNSSKCDMLKEKIIDTMSYDAWIDACKLYESFYRIPYYEVW